MYDRYMYWCLEQLMYLLMGIEYHLRESGHSIIFQQGNNGEIVTLELTIQASQSFASQLVGVR